MTSMCCKGLIFFAQFASGDAPAYNYIVNGHDYNMRYYLAHDIYLSCSTFMKTSQYSQGKNQSVFAAAQEAFPKVTERNFGVLQVRFVIFRGPARFWDKKSLSNIMKACVILHNMIIEDERI